MSTTSIDLSKGQFNTKGDEAFFITVTRIDDLLDDDGLLLVERVLVVCTTFHI
jgi:hypothetical protein